MNYKNTLTGDFMNISDAQKYVDRQVSIQFDHYDHPIAKNL